MKKIQGNECVLNAHQFSLGIMDHWIVFVIYPQDGKDVIFDSLRKTNKDVYEDFETCPR